MTNKTNYFTLEDREYHLLSPYLIAEIGVNHEGDIERAKRMIVSIAKSGGHAAKFQSYKADFIATRNFSPAYWDQTKETADSQYELFQRWDSFDEEDYRILAEECGNCGIDFISTPFDLEAVDVVAMLSPAIKVASVDVTNIPLLRKIGEKRSPVIMSTGASRFDEVYSAIQELQLSGADNISLLHCVLNYPTQPADAQLAQIRELARIFRGMAAIGYSDHIKPDDNGEMPALEIAAIMGAVIIEKHFTDDKKAKGNDHYHAMDASDLAAFVSRLERLRKMFGSPVRDVSREVSAINNARRRIIAARDISSGQVLSESDLIALRSNHGIEVSHWDRVVSQTLIKDVRKGSPLVWEDIK